jgi:putative ABC transport system permease protein
VKGELIKNTFFMPHNRIEHDFFKTYGIKIIAGRDFNRAIQTDATEAAILNETAVRLLGFDSPELAVGARIKPEGSEYMTIIGVCRDFHYESLHHKITAMISYIATDQANTVAVRLTPGNITERISAVREVWNEFHQDTPFEYSFLDERINDQYKNEQRMLGLFNWFGVLAVIIACLGLYGLTAYSTARRTKEIGIRRVNGASTREIMFMFSVDFTKLIAVAFIIICPVSYYLMHRWLQNFMYKTTLSWWVFLLAGLTAFIIALLTISWQTWRAATRDPLGALRYE